jgi:hypothetical protein
MHDREYDLQGQSFLTYINSPTAYSTPEIHVHQFTSIQRRTFTRVLSSVASRCLAGGIRSHLAYARLPPARQRSLALIL